ncbi:MULTISPECIES: 16S rRNA (adenine(1518)-N(6)/adenine(1519)-N(6))-dimethyltransferase RsmA [Helicobacter]|uniref:Dimethyladenosine transferase n=1 Tax=Helicobacter ailurogastricus TaxID=1578720 RepID=A0A0K2XCK2_9HELI|nr:MULTISPECIES: 16S rRNA (adenine(1518)-N(6)/adenine(1519)-N(6))-dimethyltransferase RsmA [Helicobacter]CRF40645.1 SSU rRNA (adenine(1518)-N(6)/adenine(1519)-N(6))-dimethyltransferase [Helicobacter ailurogastricus]CRF43038.1 SSU rRNA (adenine(1518)-N(6)/adenine(1519)-N(6))-dimethyltransferase [Helicobacter ailurogastricus]CRF44267.1 SSU rRNA (adenine(1518)-N(6)/adenine(1519)-N(6))-dimethyltransferase [Helicobacter ailurogastricus]CRF52263.1 Dimethyladenosine transferase [Helicobacter ailurogas
MALLGQHFLHDPHYLEQILQSIPHAHFADAVQMVEIGVGLGDLTSRLLSRLEPPKSLLAYEVDARLAQRLKPVLGSLSARLELVVGDVMQRKGVQDGEPKEIRVQAPAGFVGLRVCKDAFLHPRPYFLVSNLPYYIATPILTRCLRDALCVGMVVMVQKEVAVKFCATEQDSDYGALSVLCAGVCPERTLLFEVPPQAFNPPPKVRSAVMRLLKAPLSDLGAICSLPLASFESVLKVCFQANRKTLYNNLKKTYKATHIQEFFTQNGLELSLRPHQVAFTHYASLAHFLHKKLNRTTHGQQSL